MLYDSTYIAKFIDTKIGLEVTRDGVWGKEIGFVWGDEKVWN